MKRLMLASAAALALVGAAVPSNAAPTGDFDGPQIDVVFALDTTGSMSGLIEGAKRRIWSIANEILDTREQAHVRFGLIGYRDRGDAYVTQQFDLTEDIFGIYGHLLEFQAAGGGDRPESVNQALNEAITQMGWTNDPDALRLVFLVGDSPPHMDYQDDVTYTRSLELAGQRDIVVNTVLAGGASDTGQIWQEIARLGGGAFLSIPQDGGMTVIATPYDDQINSLQQRINDTVVPYGSIAEQEYLNTQLEVSRAAPAPTSSDIATYRFRAGAVNEVLTGGNDLVQDFEDGNVDLDALPAEELPPGYASMGADERRQAVTELVAARSALNAELSVLIEQRDAWLEQERDRRMAEGGADAAFDIEVARAVRDLASERGIEYED